MITYAIALTHLARTDLFDMIDYFTSKVSREFAVKKSTEIETMIMTLQKMPERGHKPHELYKISTAIQLEIIKDRIRIIYEIHTDRVFIVAIFDARQNVSSHLLKRMTYQH